jgi:hypothetical protein
LLATLPRFVSGVFSNDTVTSQGFIALVMNEAVSIIGGMIPKGGGERGLGLKYSEKSLS